MFLNKKTIGGGLLGIGVLLLIGGIFSALSMPIVGLPIVGLGVFSMIGGTILIRKSRVVMGGPPLEPDLEKVGEYSIYSSSFAARTVPQLTDDQRREFMSKLQARLLSEDELRKDVKNLLTPNHAEETKFAIVKTLFAQMRLLLNDCRRPGIKQVGFADNIKKLIFLRGVLKENNYRSVPSLLIASANNICDAVKQLLNSNEYRQAMPQEVNRAGEWTGLLEEAKKVETAMQALLESQPFKGVEEEVTRGIETGVQTRQEKQHASDLKTSDQISRQVLGFH